MAISFYDASVPVFRRHLDALEALLDKAQAHAEAKKFDVTVLLNARLYPDMYHFIKQVQSASDFAKAGAGRTADVPIPSMPDTETSIADLKERVAKTVAFLDTITPAQMTGAEARSHCIRLGPREVTFSGVDYLVNFAMPNFMFHCTAAYAILRHNGVEIGKRDFMRRLPPA